MRKSFLPIVLLLVLLTVPMNTGQALGADQPWVEIFEGKIKIGESLKVGDYQVELTLSKDHSPYIMVYQGEAIRALERAEFGEVIEVDNLRIVPGSFDGERIFLVVQYIPKVYREIAPKVGESYTVDGYTFEVLNITKEALTLKIGSSEHTIKDSAYTIHDRLVLGYLGGKLRVYLIDVNVERIPQVEYEIHYTFDEITVKAGEALEVPIEVTNNGNEDIRLPLRILSKPLNWDVRLIDAQEGYEVSEITLKASEKRYLNLAIDIPEEAGGSNVVKFSIGEELGEVKVFVQKVEKIDVKPSILFIECEAGEKVGFPVVITNYGSDKVVNVQVLEKPEGWDAYFILNGVRVRSFLLPSSASQELSLIVEIPRNAELGSHTVKVAIDNESYSFNMFVYKTYRGEKATLSLTVIDDEGSPVSRAKVYVNRTVYFTETTGRLRMELEPGKYRLTVEKEGYSNTTEEVELLDGEEKSLTITLQKAPYYFRVEMDTNTLSVSFDYQPVYEIKLINSGKEDDEYRLSLAGLPGDWAYSFLRDPQSNIGVNSISVDSGESRSIWLRILPSFNAQPGTYHAKLIAESSSGIRFEKELEIELIGNYELDVSLMNYLLSLQAGKDSTTTIMLRNHGSAPITNINFEINAPEGWKVDISPERITKLDRGEYQEVKLVIQVPETTPAGEYRVAIKVKSDQTEWEDSVRVRVKQSSSSAYLGILILAAAFGAVVLMMRRIGRR